jgi:transposase
MVDLFDSTAGSPVGIVGRRTIDATMNVRTKSEAVMATGGFTSGGPQGEWDPLVGQLARYRRRERSLLRSLASDAAEWRKLLHKIVENGTDFVLFTELEESGMSPALFYLVVALPVLCWSDEGREGLLLVLDAADSYRKS